jgi:hypothetical protein
MFRLVQQVVLTDDAALLERTMPFIKCLNAFILDERGLLKRKATAYRASRMSKAQADMLRVGEKYRLGMYVATSTRKSATSGLKEWQEGEMGGATKYSWQFSIPNGCRQATKASGTIEVSADVLEDSYDEPLDLPTIAA